jgi:4-hydroxy 2-oxovalerate aldolase
MKPAPQILDCTLRDGSYVLDFAFTKETTRTIASRLGRLGFPLIEVGHGIGLGASAKGMGVAAATDEEYMIAADSCGRKWGMFCIPGVASIEDVDLAARHGMDFIRIGCEVANVEDTKAFIERARTHGMYVYSNLMKSYAAPVDVFVTQALKCVRYGAQCVYIVDSAGGMLPSDVRTYADALRQAAPGIRLGFHGHNNLGLGVANAMLAAEMGFDVIDCSLQGLGRSGGNVPTEQFLAALTRSGYKVPYDAIDVMQAGEDLIRPLMRDAGLSSLDVTAGMAQFHSSYMSRVLGVAKERRVDPRRLIVALCNRDKLNAPLYLIEECAAAIADGPAPLIPGPYYGQEQS